MSLDTAPAFTPTKQILSPTPSVSNNMHLQSFSSISLMSTSSSSSMNGSTERFSTISTSSTSEQLSTSESEMRYTIGVEQGANTAVDPQILEALKSGKDRIFVLKLGEQMEGLIQERNLRAKLELIPETSYQKLLIYRCAAFYRLTLETESVNRAIGVIATIESKIPPRRLSDLVPAEETSHPTFKIMRRSVPDRRRPKAPPSQAGSTAGDEGSSSDREPSEAGSQGGSGKKRMTIAEREAAYQEARSRIFMDFEEKERAKERDVENSSTVSLVSGSGSTSGGGGSGSPDDFEETGSTGKTESEWSYPITREAKDRRRVGGSGFSSKSIRPSGSSFEGRRSGSLRGSGSNSPAYTYPSLYDPSAPTSGYDAGQAYAAAPHPGAYVPSYPVYSYSAPGQPPAGQPYYGPYAYYPGYAYPYPPHLSRPLQTSSDPTSPAGSQTDVYAHFHPQHGPYVNPYFWPHGPQQYSSPEAVQSPPMAGQEHGGSQAQSPTAHTLPGPQYHSPPPHQAYLPAPGHYATCPPMYYPPTTPQSQALPLQPPFPPEFTPASHSGMYNEQVNVNNNGANGDLSRSSSKNGSNRNSAGSGGNGHDKHGTPFARSSWSYGPGMTVGGLGYNNSPSTLYQANQSGSENVGSRISSNGRRTASATSINGNGNGGAWTPFDESGSTTSSSSSSSRRTFSSMHPLPARPDWATGMKPQPTLHQSNHKRDSNNISRNMSPVPSSVRLPQNRTPQHQQSQQLDPIFLQPTDFPPLSMSSSNEKRLAPAAGNVWTNPARSVLVAPALTGLNPSSSSSSLPDARSDKHDTVSARSPGSAGPLEFSNPHLSQKCNGSGNGLSSSGDEHVRREKAHGETVTNTNLVDKMAMISFGSFGDDEDDGPVHGLNEDEHRDTIQNNAVGTNGGVQQDLNGPS